MTEPEYNYKDRSPWQNQSTITREDLYDRTRVKLQGKISMTEPEYNYKDRSL